jgi:ribonucleoside-diphosphate reductase alpha chain
VAFSKNALYIMEKFYLKKDKNGNLIEKSFEETFTRVSDFVSSAEKNIEVRQRVSRQFFDLMAEQKFMFSSPTLFNAGSEFPLSSSCFVGGLEDDTGAIMKAASDTAVTFKSGAGMGLNFGVLRPKNAPVGRGGTSSGPVSFMRLFDEVGEAVKSGGVRRAAFMAMMDVGHPDIEEFITSKDYTESIGRQFPDMIKTDNFTEHLLQSISETISGDIKDDGAVKAVINEIRKKLFEPLSNMNISVAITDEFMNSVKNDMEFSLNFKNTSKKIVAKELFRKIALSAWRTADPGVWFIDRANDYDTVPSLGRILSTNPCGEQSLHSFTSCNLGSINLNKFVSEKGFNFRSFSETVSIAVRGLDNVIEVSEFPTEKFKVETRKIRPIGLGYTGLAEVLFKLRIPYNSDKGYALASDISRVMTQTAIETSIELAKEKGSFGIFNENKQALIKVAEKYYDSDGEKSAIRKSIDNNGIRNSNWTTLAPTGTISLILDASTYSLEPQFALAYYKNLIDGGSLEYADPEFEKAIGSNHAIIKKVIENGGSCNGIMDIPENIRNVFVVSHDISFQDRIDMQAAVQKYISNSISSTINLPNNISVDEIENIYLKAWDAGLKGVTIYRDGAKFFQPMTSAKAKKEPVNEKLPESRKWERPRVLNGDIFKTKTGSGTLYTSVGLDENGFPVEIFINISKHGSDVSAFSEALGRVISIALQHGIPVESIADTIIGITGDSSAWDSGKLIKSIPDAVGRILKDFAEKHSKSALEQGLFEKKTAKEKDDRDKPKEIKGAINCPHCGEKSYIKTEDCSNCLSCGFSRCS